MGWIKSSGKISRFFKTGSQIHYKKGEVILRPEDTPSGMYYIEKGFIKAYSLTSNGAENIYILFQPGDMFPHRWEFIQGFEKVLSYESISPVTVYRKPLKEYSALLNSDIEVLKEIHEAFEKILSVFLARIENLEHTNSNARVVLRLLGLAKTFGIQKGNEVTITVPLTHYNLAHTINMSRETASRELEKLKRKKLISESKQIITILNLKALEEEFTGIYEDKH